MNAYLIGTPYSGSTLLGNALNGNPQVFHAGEVSRLPAFGIGPSVHECMVCRVLGRSCPVWGNGLVERIGHGHPARALGAIRAATGCETVVDSSKHVEWLRMVLRDGVGDDIRVIVTVRHPYGFAASVHRTDGLAAWQAANVWRDTVYDAFRELGRSSIPFMVVRYEDFARGPEPELRRICSFLSVGFDPGSLRFWATDVHALGGNPHAYVWYRRYVDELAFESEFAADRRIAEDFRARPFGGWVDDRWRTELSSRDMREIRATPLLPDLVHIVGYGLEPE